MVESNLKICIGNGIYFYFLVSNLPKLPAIHHDNEFFVNKLNYKARAVKQIQRQVFVNMTKVY